MENQIEKLRGLVLDIAHEQELEPSLVACCLHYLATRKEIVENDFTIFYFSYITDGRLTELQSNLRLKHRPELIRETEQKLSYLNEQELFDLSDGNNGMVHLKAIQQGTKPQKYHVETMQLAKAIIRQAKEKYAARDIAEVIEIYLFNHLEPLIKKYTLCQKNQ